MRISSISLALLALVAPVACDPGDEPILGDADYVRDPALDISLRSAHGEARSHAQGDNCMACHQPNGPGPGLFTAAGTLYDISGDPLPDGAVELRTAPDGNGDLVARIEVDGLGNFFTTDELPLPDTALFPTVYSPDGAARNYMPFPTASAACNVCHVGGFVVRVPEA